MALFSSSVSQPVDDSKLIELTPESCGVGKYFALHESLEVRNETVIQVFEGCCLSSCISSGSLLYRRGFEKFFFRVGTDSERSSLAVVHRCLALATSAALHQIQFSLSPSASHIVVIRFLPLVVHHSHLLVVAWIRGQPRFSILHARSTIPSVSPLLSGPWLENGRPR